MTLKSLLVATRRYEAAAWLRKVVGFVGAKDLPAELSEEDFRLGLRSGIILCNVLNKIQPGAVSKVKYDPKLFHPPSHCNQLFKCLILCVIQLDSCLRKSSQWPVFWTWIGSFLPSKLILINNCRLLQVRLTLHLFLMEQPCQHTSTLRMSEIFWLRRKS